MTMRNHYVVEVTSAPREEPALVVERVAEVLKLTPEKAAALVGRMPGAITKPLPEERALRVVLRLQGAGLAAVHRRATAADADGPLPSPARAPEAPAGAQSASTKVSASERTIEPAVASVLDAEPPLVVDAAPMASGEPALADDAAPMAAPMPAPADAAAAAAATTPALTPQPPLVAAPPASIPAPPFELQRHDYGVRNPTGFDLIPSLDATRIDEPIIDEPDPKLTPVSEAGFGAADILLPVDEAKRRAALAPSILQSGPLSRPVKPQSDPYSDDALIDDDALGAVQLAAEAPPPEADPTTVAPRQARADAPQAPRYERQAADATSAARNGGVRDGGRAPQRGEPAGAGGAVDDADTPPAGPRPSLRLRDAIARDRDSRDGVSRPPPEVSERPITPQDVTYRSTRNAAERPLTLTPPPDAVLKRSGIEEDALSIGRERRRGRFARRLSTLVTLPAVLSWLLSATFIYLLLPEAQRVELWIPMAAATAIAALTGALAAGLVTSRIANDVASLQEDSERIAMGDLSMPVRLQRSDELGEVAAAVERLRISLQESLERLRKRR